MSSNYYKIPVIVTQQCDIITVLHIRTPDSEEDLWAAIENDTFVDKYRDSFIHLDEGEVIVETLQEIEFDFSETDKIYMSKGK